MKDYYISTFGCQMNISDSERIASVLEQIGYNPASNINEADLVVVNMCSVRQSAVDRIYGLAKNIKKLNKSPFSILTGCILEKDKKKFSKLFSHIINIKDIEKLHQILLTKSVIIDDRPLLQNNYFEIKPKFSGPIAYIPIMTGCNNFCAYCVVPYVRGREISRPVKDIINEVKNAIKNGAKEIWLLGQNVNNYYGLIRTNGPMIKFPKLLKMLNDISGNFWIKFTSSHPKPSTRTKLSAGPVPHQNEVSGAGDFSWDELLMTMKKCHKVAKYLNLPVQSGNNKILKKMNRPYTIVQYKKLIRKIRKAMPNIALSTDIIVGFPTETKSQFESSANLLRYLKFDMAYISQYSERRGTAAAKIKDGLSKQEKEKREKILNGILKETAFQNNKKMVGEKIKALVLEKKKDFFIGKTEGNKTVKIEGNECKIGDFIEVKITEALPWGLRGKINF